MYRKFPEFALATLRGLLSAAVSDHNVFLLYLGGALSGGRRGLGKAMLLHVAAMRLDDVLKLWVIQTNKIAQAIDDERT